MSATHAARPARDTVHARTANATMGRRIFAGVLGGPSGGIVFGALMAVMGMLTMIASLVGAESAGAALAVHLVISVLIGLGLTVPLAGMLTGHGRGAVLGLLYGALWWVLGPLLLMPLMLGMPLFTLDPASLMSLVGHLVFGLILGLVAVRVLRGRR